MYVYISGIYAIYTEQFEITQTARLYYGHQFQPTTEPNGVLGGAIDQLVGRTKLLAFVGEYSLVSRLNWEAWERGYGECSYKLH